MKRIFYLLTVLLFPCWLNAQDLHFAASYDSAFIQAKEQGKMVLVYAYSPCRMCDDMYAKVLTLPDISNFLNELFILVDMDTDERAGVLFKRKYNITTCPSFLLFDSKGVLQHKIVGVCPGEELLAKIANGLNLKSNYHGTMTRYNKGERTLDLLPDYLVALSDAAESKQMSEISKDFFPHFSQTELASKKGWLLFDMCVNDYRDPVFQSFLNNKSFFEEKLGTETINLKIRNVVVRAFLEYIQKSGNSSDAALLQNTISHAGEPEHEILSALFTAHQQKDHETIMKVFEDKVFNVEPKFRFVLSDLLAPLMKGKEKEYHERISGYIIKCIADLRARRAHVR